MLTRIKNSLFNAYADDASKMLLHMGTLGWILSAAAQIWGIANNDKIDAHQKKFLIPQEIADALVNIVSFYTVTALVQNTAKRLVFSGKISTKSIQKFCKEHNVEYGKFFSNNIGKTVRDKIKELENTVKIKGDVEKEDGFNMKGSIGRTENLLGKYKRFEHDHFEPLEGGIGVVGSVVGSILSSNIITPILRNPIAAARQKQSKSFNSQVIANTNPTTLPAYAQRQNIDNYKQQSVAKQSYTGVNSSLKI